MISSRKYHIGVVGTGFIAKGLILNLKNYHQLEVVSVLTRRPINTIKGFPVSKKVITQNVDKFIRSSDLVVECTGDAIHGTVVSQLVLKAGIPMVTMNPELQITSGSMLTQMGTFIEAEGDQPGTLAALDNEVRNMGFEPLVYGNIKRFLNLTPTQEEMKYWSKRQGISLTQVTAFTDGSKVQVEQALVANGLGATITQKGLTGIECTNHEDGAKRLAELAEVIGKPISDYVLSQNAPAGVFIVAKHDKSQAPYLEYLKLGKGPFYVIVKPYHLCHLEIGKTITNVLTGNTDYNFSNGVFPTIQVASVAKTQIKSGEKIERGLGGFKIRGEAIKIHDNPNAVPITLIHKAKFANSVKPGQVITFKDVKLPQTLALKLWQQTLKKVKAIPDAKTDIAVPQESLRKLKKPVTRRWPLSVPQLSNTRLKTLLKRS